MSTGTEFAVTWLGSVRRERMSNGHEDEEEQLGEDGSARWLR